jgi:hypothetical protein
VSRRLDGAGPDATGGEACAGSALEGMLGWWRFDEGAGAVAADSSENGLDGALAGDPDWIVGNVGGALRFDGQTDRVELAAGTFEFQIPVTLTAWVRPTRIVDVHSLMGRDAQLTEVVRQFQWRVSEERIPSFTLYPDCGSEGQLSVGASAPVGIDGAWTHLAVTIDLSGAVTHYIGGAAGPPGTIARVTVCPESATTSIGGTPTSEGGPYMWDGSIDEVRAYGRALSPCEIAEVRCYGTWHCTNGVQDCNETGVDSGGDCD